MVWRYGVLVVCGLALAGCRPTPPPTPPHGDGTLAGARSFAYQLSHLNAIELAASRYDVLIVDVDGIKHPFTSAQLDTIRHGPGGRKLVLAYLSVGMAEDGRWYWNDNWDADGDGQPNQGAPPWLVRENTEFPGSYWVEYWRPEWRKLVTQSLDRLVDLGFDGVVLDPFDADDYWGPQGDSGTHRATADTEMVDLMAALAHHARVERGRPSFVVLGQNCADFVGQPAFLECIDGVLAEDIWYDNEKRKPAEETEERVGYLDALRAQGKQVLAVEYLTNPHLINAFYNKAAAKHYLPYATRKQLNRLTVNPGHAPG